MKLLIGLICFLLGWIAGIVTRNIRIRIDKVNNKIKMAERIIAEENERKEFLKKYDFEISEKEK